MQGQNTPCKLSATFVTRCTELTFETYSIHKVEHTIFSVLSSSQERPQ